MSETLFANHRLKIERIEQAGREIDPVFLDSPQFICEPLGDLLGVPLILKVETLNPIRCFKGRGADFLVSQMAEPTGLICASAGNFGQAMAYACRKRKVPLTVYASTKANPLKLDRMRRMGAEVILYGQDFDAAKLEAKRVAAESGLRMVEDSLDIETVEGAGTIGLELLDFATKIDQILIPLGNGAMFNGIARMIKARSSQTRTVAVQSRGASAMVESIRSGQLITHASMDTIADGIAVRIPVPQALVDIRDLVDDTILVEEASIIQGMRLLHQHTGLVVEPSAGVGVAALLENRSTFAGQSVATIICGGNLTDDQIKEFLWPA